MTYHVSFPGLGIYDLPINPIAFSFNIFGKQIDIFWYGIIIALAFALCISLSLRHARQFGFRPEQLSDIYLAIIPSAIVGARLYYVAFAWHEFKDNPLLIFNTRIGGLAFYGGVIGAVLAIALMCKIKRIKVFNFLDFASVYLPLGQAIGRWGNFFNQEAFGVNTNLPWGMHSEGTAAYLSTLPQVVGNRPDLPVHPTFFYEFVANLMIFAILLIIRRRDFKLGTNVMVYLLLYGITRFFVEGLRTDPLLIGNTTIRVSQFLSLIMILGAIIGLLIIKLRSTKEENELV